MKKKEENKIYSVNDYNFQFGTFHSVRSQYLQYFWQCPELEVFVAVPSPIHKYIFIMFERIKKMAEEKLLILTREGKKHPRPLKIVQANLWDGDNRISTGKAAKILKVSVSSVRRLIKDGILKATQTKSKKGIKGANFSISLDSLTRCRNLLETNPLSPPTPAPQSEAIENAPKASDGNQSIGAIAKKLGVHRSTVWRWKKRGIAILN